MIQPPRPAISLPCKVDAHTLPIGFQLCAAHGRDKALLEFARDCEQAAGQAARWPPL